MRAPPLGSSRDERAALARLSSPERIQDFLDAIPYHGEITCRSPRRVLRDRRAHCFEGAMLAAAALERLGHAPLLVNMRAVRDDDHVLAVFRRGPRWGALAKSNTTGLRYRAPLYASLRELVMSYFDDYFNTLGERTLRAYSRPMRLTDRAFPGWRTSERDLDALGERLDRVPHVAVVSAREARLLPRVSEIKVRAGFLGANEKGLYRPEER